MRVGVGVNSGWNSRSPRRYASAWQISALPAGQVRPPTVQSLFSCRIAHSRHRLRPESVGRSTGRSSPPSTSQSRLLKKSVARTT